MDNHTVVQLKAIAKERGIIDYYKLRKAESIHALEAARLVEETSNMSRSQIIPLQFYNTCRPQKVGTKDKQKIKNLITKGM